MDRILKYTVEMFPSSQVRPQVCVETKFQLGTQTPNRILHFGVAEPLSVDDVEFICSRIDETLVKLIIRTLNPQGQLVF